MNPDENVAAAFVRDPVPPDGSRELQPDRHRGPSDSRSGNPRPVLILAGPDRGAVSGVSTHLEILWHSGLAQRFTLVHFQVGREGRTETPGQRVIRQLLSPFLLAILILRHDAGLVHLNTSLNRGAYWRDLAYLLIAKICGARVIYQVHGGALPQSFFSGSRLLTAFLRASLSWPDVVVVLAQAELDAYRSFSPGLRLRRIANGIDVGTYGAIRRSGAATDAGLTLLYLGRLAREKGIYEILEAVRLAHVRGQRLHLLIAGEGSESGGVRRRIKELGLAPMVTILGPVFGPEKMELLRSADVFVLPSHGEGLPYALLEAMAAGLPAIATRVGAIPDVMTDGTHGYLVPCRDPAAIASAIRLLADSERRARMGEACRARIRAAFSVNRVIADFGSLYDELCTPLSRGAGSAKSPRQS